jgi:hypothetical protein
MFTALQMLVDRRVNRVALVVDALAYPSIQP